MRNIFSLAYYKRFSLVNFLIGAQLICIENKAANHFSRIEKRPVWADALLRHTQFYHILTLNS